MEFKPSKMKGARIISTEKTDGAMNFNLDKGANLNRFLVKNGIQNNLAFGEQVHQNKIFFCKEAGIVPLADGVMTDQDLALAVKSADCLPLLFYSKDRNIIGAIHVSRLNLVGGIVDSFASACQQYRIDLAKTFFFFGPHIRKNSYPLSEEAFKSISKSRFECFLGSGKSFDLTEAVATALEQNGALRENIEDCGIDTFLDKRFFSLRANGGGSSVSVFATIIFRI